MSYQINQPLVDTICFATYNGILLLRDVNLGRTFDSKEKISKMQ